jgi:parallel beta-helix repeat protein
MSSPVSPNLSRNIARVTALFPLVCLFFIGSTAKASAATTFYMSSSVGNDANDGRSPEKPWQHLSKIYLKSISAQPFQPGDSILLKRGDEWEGQIHLQANGTSNAPIVIGAYGQGTKPLLIGEARHPRWEKVLSHPEIYTIDLGAGGILGGIVQDGKTLRAIYPSAPLKQKEDMQIFFSKLQPGTLAGQLNGRVWIRLADGQSLDAVRVFGYAGVSLSNSSYVRVENLDIERFSAGMDIENSHNVVIQHNDVRNVLGLGIYLRSGDSDCRVESNTVTHSGNTALYVLKGERNTFRDNWVSHVDNSVLGIPTGGDHMGIGLQESRETLVEHNYFTYGGGIDFYYEEGSTVRYNYLTRVSSAGAPHGVNLNVYGNIYDLSGEQGRSASTGVNAVVTGPGTIAVYNNTIYDASKFFMMGSAGKGDGKVIFSDNIAASTVGGATLAAFGPDVVSNHNCFFAPGDLVFTYAKKPFHDLATYREISGLEKDSIVGDPQFVSITPITPLDFRIAVASGCNSPAVDITATERARTYDHDLGIADRVVIGAFQADPKAKPSGKFRQLCSHNCLGRRFEVSNEVYLLRMKVVAGAELAQAGLIINDTKVAADANPQLISNDDLFRYFLVRPGGGSIVLEPDVGTDTLSISEISILPFDTSHGEGTQVISW